MFLHEHNLPFLLMDHLPGLIKSVCPDSRVAQKIKCGRTKATAMTRECLAMQQLYEITEKLENNVFSLIIDETTDINTEKALALVTRFFDSGQWKDRFLGLVKINSCSAEDLFNIICEYLKKMDIPLTNLIGFAADNAAVMMGNIKGVQARFKKMLPNIFVLGCVCHSFHLCSSVAAKKLPSCLEDFIRAIYAYFAHSTKIIEKLIDLQTFVELKPKKILHPSPTRWLSLQAAVDRVLENWEALRLFFTHECFEDNLQSTKSILDSLNNPIYKIYFSFLAYILEIVNKLNIEFQSEKPKLHLLLTRVTDLYRTILRNYIKKPHLDNKSLALVDPADPKHFIQLEQIYYGTKVELLLLDENLDLNEVHSFRIRSLEFYIELCVQIKKRFNFDDPVLLFVNKFSPKKVLSGEVNSISLETFKLFPNLFDNLENLTSEWRLLADMQEMKQFENDSIQNFWTRIFQLKNELDNEIFPNLTKLLMGVLSLPHSSAAAERVFSQLNLLKTKTRNRLQIDTCDSILHSKELLDNDLCYTWKPSLKLIERSYNY